MKLKPDSQNARVLRVLSDGRWHTGSNVQRRSGANRLNSRISELRARGFEIESERIGGAGLLSHRYRLLKTVAVEGLVTPRRLDDVLDRETVPRDLEHRFRVYRCILDELELVGTAATPEDLGWLIVQLGRLKRFESSCMGVLDTFGHAEEKGTWLLNPFDTAP